MAGSDSISLTLPSLDLSPSHADHSFDPFYTFDHLTRHSAHVQRLTLQRILQRNAHTLYLHQFRSNLRLHDRRLSDDHALALEQRFKAAAPLSTYADIESYVHRIADGGEGSDSSLLCADPIVHLNMSSGTSAGRPKLFPATQYTAQQPIDTMWLSAAFRNRIYPISDDAKCLAFAHAAKRFDTKSGIKAGAVTANYFWSDAFKRKTQRRPPIANYVSPDEVLFEPDAQQSIYCHFLCALLRSPELEFCSSLFPFSIIEALKAFEKLWPVICDDIESGKLNKRITSPSLRASMNEFLHWPDPQLAMSIRSECQKSSWCGILERLWPNMKYVQCILTGPMASYEPILRHYAGRLPLVCGEYGCSECAWLGLNLNARATPDTVSFTLVPHLAYVEFLHVQSDRLNSHSGDQTTVGIEGLEIGQEYELVLTTYAGLYRHRVGDIVKITGYYNMTPQFKYVGRKNGLLSVGDDKTDEQELRHVVELAAMRLRETTGLEVVEYSSHAAKGMLEEGHYEIFWELSGGEMDDARVVAALERCCEMLDRSLGYYYQKGRGGVIGPLQLRVVRPGTFAQVAQEAMRLGAHWLQYKTPKIITSPALLATLHHGTLHRFSSPPLSPNLLAHFSPLP